MGKYLLLKDTYQKPFQIYYFKDGIQLIAKIKKKNSYYTQY
jgi:hypothetical protein